MTLHNVTFKSNTFTLQYKARGTPHIHSLICISKADGIDSGTVDRDDVVEQNKVKSYVKVIVSTILVKMVDSTNIRVVMNGKDQQDMGDTNISDKVELDESDFLWNPSREYFSDEIHPCRLSFNAHLNYERSADGAFADNDV